MNKTEIKNDWTEEKITEWLEQEEVFMEAEDIESLAKFMGKQPAGLSIAHSERPDLPNGRAHVQDLVVVIPLYTE